MAAADQRRPSRAALFGAGTPCSGAASRGYSRGTRARSCLVLLALLALSAAAPRAQALQVLNSLSLPSTGTCLSLMDMVKVPFSNLVTGLTAAEKALVSALLAPFSLAGLLAPTGSGPQSTVGFYIPVSLLPTSHPVQSWPYRARSTAVTPDAATNTTTWVSSASVTHATLAGLNTSELLWWFKSDLQTRAPYPNGATPRQNYSLYTQWHPRDHCNQINTFSGSSFTGFSITEYFNASRNWTQTFFIDGLTTWASIDEAQTNVQLTGQWLNSSGISLAFQMQALNTNFTLAQLTHRWRDVPGGVSVSSTFQLGQPGLPAIINHLVGCGFSRTAKPTTVLGKWQTHCVEEFGNFVQLLPFLYNYFGGVPAGAGWRP